MTVSVKWFNPEQTIVLYTLEGHWTWNELYPEYDKAIEMEEGVSHRVDVMIDMRKSTGVPLSALTHLKNISDKQPENIGVSVIVTTNRLVLTLYRAGCRFHTNIERYFAVAATEGEALQIIERQRQTTKKTA